jgi:hypothetical protein
MSVDFDRFLSWAEGRFDNVIVKGDEIKLNSIFEEDHKNHMWCNPSGGKKNRPNGVFHCWKTDTKGSLVSLVMQVENCTYEEAIEILGGADSRLSELERRVAEIFNPPNKDNTKQKVLQSTESLRLPPFTYLFEDLPSSNYHRVRAEVYLFQRKLPAQHFMVCTAGKYANRIIIPYYDRKGKLIYWNGRHLGNSNLRYQGPDDQDNELNPQGTGKGDVLYFPQWPEKGTRVFLAEGEFDGMSLLVSKLPAGAFGGKSLTETQMKILRENEYFPTICLDNDKAGRMSLPKMGDALLQAGFSKIGFVRPPVQYKDWNAFLQKHNAKIMNTYVLSRVKEYTEWTSTMLNMQQL